MRPTHDVDIVVHIETVRGVPQAVARALESIGYRLAPSIDPRIRTAHRFVRGSAAVDIVASTHEDQIDVLIADHATPGSSRA
mgnify:CR=1 FL=1